MKKYQVELFVNNKLCSKIYHHGFTKDVVEVELGIYFRKQGFKNFNLKITET